MKKYLIIGKLVQLLARKVQKQNYFLFVRLQQNILNLPKNHKIPDNSIPPTKIPQQHKISQKYPIPQQPPIKIPPTPKQTNPKASPTTKQPPIKIGPIPKLDTIKKGLQNMIQIIKLIQLKHQNISMIQYAFLKLTNYSIKKKYIFKIIHILSKIQRINVISCFNKIHHYQKYLLASQLFISVFIHLLQPKVKSIFYQIKNYHHPNSLIKHQQSKDKQKRDRLKLIDTILHPLPHIKPTTAHSVTTSPIHHHPDQICKYITPQKNTIITHYPINRDDQLDLKTSRKQHRNPILTRKSTKKQHQYIQQDESTYIISSWRKKSSEYSSIQKLKNSVKPTTKIHPNKTKITLPPAYQIQTFLSDYKTIPFQPPYLNIQNQCMLKYNKLYSQSIIHPLPDLHDNLGVFDNLWSQQDKYSIDDFIFSHRTTQKSLKQYTTGLQTQFRIAQPKQKLTSQQYLYNKTQQKSINTNQHWMANSNITKQSIQNITITDNNKSLPFNKNNSTKYNFQTISNSSNYATGSFINQNNANQNDQFCSSPLEKIQQMMMDLEKLRDKEKYNCKFSTGYQKCKISVNLPNRKNSTCQGKSYQGSTNKINCTTLSKNPNQSKSQKKQFYRDKHRRHPPQPLKQNNQPKDYPLPTPPPLTITPSLPCPPITNNIQLKIWNEKNKYQHNTTNQLKYHGISKQKRKNSNLKNSITPNQINTARKVKKQIQSIFNNRKNRTSLGDLKLVKNKF